MKLTEYMIISFIALEGNLEIGSFHVKSTNGPDFDVSERNIFLHNYSTI